MSAELWLPPAELLVRPGRMTIYDRMRAAVGSLGAQHSQQSAYPTGLADFITEVLGADLWEKQREICQSVEDHRYTAVASCHGTGKTYLAARIAIAFLQTRPRSLVLTTAPTGRQVEHVLWRNIRKAAQESMHPLMALPGHPLTTRWDIAPDWYAIGFKPNDTETDPAQGFHAEDILVLIEEAAGVSQALFDGLLAAMTSERARTLAIGNPTSTTGNFFDAFHSQAGTWHGITISWEDTPNAQAGQTVRPYLITQQWVDDAIRRYGLEHPYVQSRVFSRWASGADVLIPLAWLDAAKARGADEVPFGAGVAGMDVARYGTDLNVLAIRSGWWIEEYIEWRGYSLPDSAGRALQELARYPQVTEIRVDVGGLGGGVVDSLRDEVTRRGLDLLVTAVNFGNASSDPTAHRNARDQMYWEAHHAFRLGQIAGNLHPQAVAELSDTKYTFDLRHTQPIIESKEEYRKRHNGASPDYADATVMCLVAPPKDADEGYVYLGLGSADVRWGRG